MRFFPRDTGKWPFSNRSPENGHFSVAGENFRSGPTIASPKKLGRFANFVREPGLNLNSPTFSREKPPNSGEIWALFVLDALW